MFNSDVTPLNQGHQEAGMIKSREKPLSVCPYSVLLLCKPCRALCSLFDNERVLRASAACILPHPPPLLALFQQYFGVYRRQGKNYSHYPYWNRGQNLGPTSSADNRRNRMQLVYLISNQPWVFQLVPATRACPSHFSDWPCAHTIKYPMS